MSDPSRKMAKMASVKRIFFRRSGVRKALANAASTPALSLCLDFGPAGAARPVVRGGVPKDASRYAKQAARARSPPRLYQGIPEIRHRRAPSDAGSASTIRGRSVGEE